MFIRLTLFSVETIIYLIVFPSWIMLAEAHLKEVGCLALALIEETNPVI